MKPIMSQTVMSADQAISSTEKLAPQPGTKPKWSLKRKLLVGGSIALVIVIALAVGLGVGLTRHNRDSSDTNDDTDSSSPSSNNTSIDNDPSFNSSTMWAPTVGLTWNLVLRYALNTTNPGNTQVWDIDLFDNNRSTITGLQQHNAAKVICYFSAGSSEDWRPDYNQFTSSDLGHGLDGWQGERWLNVSSPNVRKIMLARLDLAVQKGCNGVDPDNVDGYDNDNGLDLTQAQAVDYLKFLANAAHSRGLAIGLKNAGAIIPQILPYMQWSVNEQCAQFNECDTYAAFIRAGKPVFHVEYPKGTDTNNNNEVDATAKTKACSNSAASGFSTIIKNMILDLWTQTY